MATRRPAAKPASRRKAPPPRRGRTLVAVIIGAALGAGGLTLVSFTRPGDSGSGDTTTTSVASSVPVPDTTQAPPTTAAPDTTPPPDTTAPATTTTTTPPVREITVVMGLDDGPERVDTVPLGSPVELRLTNPDADDEFHLHGYDLGNGISVPAGETLTLSFVADRAGLFEVESHVTHDVILVLLVE